MDGSYLAAHWGRNGGYHLVLIFFKSMLGSPSRSIRPRCGVGFIASSARGRHHKLLHLDKTRLSFMLLENSLQMRVQKRNVSFYKIFYPPDSALCFVPFVHLCFVFFFLSTEGR